MALIAQVIPILRLTPNLGVFDYLIPDTLASQIKLNQLVRMPFRKQPVLGIVVRIGNTSEFPLDKLKPLIAPYHPEILLDPNWIKIVRQTAQKYYCSPALLLKTALPTFPKKGFVDIPFIKQTPSTAEKPNLIVFQHRKDALMDLKTRVLATKGPVVILVPFVSMIQEIHTFLAPEVSGPFAFIHKQQTPKEYLQTWMRILRGEAKIIIGTRLACFAPLKEVGTYFLLHEDQLDFKQYDQNPRYDARLVLQYWNHYFGSPIHFYSHCPRAQTFHKTSQQYTLTQLPQYEIPAPTVIPMRQEQKENKKNLISFSLEEAITDCLAEKKHAVLWLNRLGNEQIIFCGDCHQTMTCPDCHLTLRIKKDMLICPLCDKHLAIPLHCPSCHGPNLLPLGTGLEKVATYLQKTFPDTPVTQIHADQSQPPSLEKPQILLGTDYLFHHLLPTMQGNIGLLAGVDITQHKNPYDIAADEHWFAQILRLLYIAQEQDATCLLQSFEDTIPHLVELTENKRAEFLNQELVWRKEAMLPPFGRLIKIICKDPDEKTLQANQTKLLKQLTIVNKCDIIKILGTYRIKRTKTQIQTALILKQSNPEVIIKIPPLPPDYQIDIDYETTY